MSINSSDILVSVIIPEYCGKGRIDKCIEELDQQTFNSFEVVIVDDCSPDDSSAYIEEFIKKVSNPTRFRLIRSAENLRAGGARNLGIKNANGQFIVYVDQDDYPDREMIERLYAATESSCYDCVVCDVSDKQGIHHRPSITTNQSQEEIKKVFSDSCGYVFAILINKKVVEENHLLFPERLLYEDSLYNCGLFLCTKNISKIEKTLYYRNGDESSQTATLSIKKLEDRVSATLWYLTNFASNENIRKHEESIVTVAFYYIYISCIWWMLCDKKLFSKELFDVCLSWARRQDVDWERIWNNVKKRGFSRLKVSVLKLIYDDPRRFGLFAPIMRVLFSLKRFLKLS